jgi:hypothetical protein
MELVSYLIIVLFPSAGITTLPSLNEVTKARLRILLPYS